MASLCPRAYFSHTGILLKEHLRAVGEECRRLVVRAGISDDKLLTAAELVGKCHDWAKYSAGFQKYLQRSERGAKRERVPHATLSAAYAAWLTNKTLKEPFLTATAFITVYSHHGSLDLRFDDLADTLQENIVDNPAIEGQLSSIESEFSDISREMNEIGIGGLGEFLKDYGNGLRTVYKALREASPLNQPADANYFEKFYTVLLLFSTLIDADKRHAAGMGLAEPKPHSLSPLLIEHYKKRRFSGQAEASQLMDELRNKLYSHVMDSLEKLIADQPLPRIFTLTAPTGSGKTLTGLSVALRLREKLGRDENQPIIVYCLPYINIIEQTYDVFNELLANPEITVLLKHHHLYVPQPTPSLPVEQALMLMESWNAEIVVTTFIQFLHTLLGVKNSFLKKFHRLYNSIVILDEAQTLPIEYWKLFREAFTRFPGIIKNLIFMTATQPIIFDKYESKELVSLKEDFFSQLERYQLEYVGQKQPSQLVEFALKKLLKEGSTLLVLNKIKTSIQVYQAIKEKLGSEAVALGSASEKDELKDKSKILLCYLSTNITPYERGRRIDTLKRLLKEGRKALAVTTQVVEAGVDLDFEVAIRDIGPVDSIVQVAGRCNRSFRKTKGRVYVVEVTDEEGKLDSVKIYGNLSIEIARKILKSRGMVEEREILDVINEYFTVAKRKFHAEESDASRRILDAIKNLDFPALRDFKLIEEPPKGAVFVEENAEARRIREEFIALWEKRHEITEYNAIFRFKSQLRAKRIELENYIVESWDESFLPAETLTEQLDIRYIPLGKLDEYYDRETGLRKELRASVW